MDLTDDQWRLLQPLLPPPSPALRGRPPLDDHRILDAILWKLRTDSPWYDLPDTYPSYQTCYRRYRFWLWCGVFTKVLSALYQDLSQRGGLDVRHALKEGILAVKHLEGRWAWDADPSLEGTWQLSTALVFVSLALKEARRRVH